MTNYFKLSFYACCNSECFCLYQTKLKLMNLIQQSYIKLEQRDFIYSEENVPGHSLNGSNRNENLRRIKMKLFHHLSCMYES